MATENQSTTKTEEVTTQVVDLTEKGFGPITTIMLGEIDTELVEKGQVLFTNNCTACHQIEKKTIGPALKGVTKRRSPEWIMNMIINPELMLENDTIAMLLLEEYKAPMPNQYLNIDQARALLEYLRTIAN